MLLTLEAWAARHIEDPPSRATLRAWAKAGRIQGAVRCGRRGGWRVPEGARLLHYTAPRSDDPVVNGILEQS
jgi:hypothetical protein